MTLSKGFYGYTFKGQKKITSVRPGEEFLIFPLLASASITFLVQVTRRLSSKNQAQAKLYKNITSGKDVWKCTFLLRLTKPYQYLGCFCSSKAFKDFNVKFEFDS